MIAKALLPTLVAVGLLCQPALAQTADDAEFGTFVRIPADSFIMGSRTGDADERPLRRVTFSQPFEMLAHEVTVGQFLRFVDESGYDLGADCRYYVSTGSTPDPYRHASQPGFDQSPEHPVVCVSAQDARAYAAWATAQTGRVYRLPTEAEWEYAARAGGGPGFVWGDGGEPCRHANISDLDRAKAHHDGRHYFGNDRMYRSIDEQTALCDDGAVFTAPVGSYQPNAFGLHDMIGNAWEWVADCVKGGLGAVPPYTDAPADGSAVVQAGCNRTVIRGSSWHTGPRYSQASNRSSVPSDYRMYHLGFRLVREGPAETIP